MSTDSESPANGGEIKPWIEEQCLRCHGIGRHMAWCTARSVPLFVGPWPSFVGVKRAVMRGDECVATACSKTMAKRIANALNRHKPNLEGV